MSNLEPEHLERWAFTLVNSARGLGIESARELVLRLIFLAAVDPGGGAGRLGQLRNTLSHDPDSAAAVLASQMADAFGGLGPAFVDPRWFADTGRALRAIEPLLFLDGPNSPPPETYAQLFDAVLAIEWGRSSSVYQTAAGLAQLIVDLVEPAGHVVDLACGYGELLVRAARWPDVRVSGLDSQAAAAEIARMRLFLHGGHGQILTTDASMAAGRFGPFDRVIIDPPWGGRGTGDSGFKTDFEWADLAHSMLTHEGRAAVVLPESANHLTPRLHALLTANAVEAVVALPARSRYGSDHQPYIWLLNGPRRSPRSEVLMVNASTMGTIQGDRTVALSELDRKKIVSAVKRWRGGGETLSGPLSKAVALDEIEAGDRIVPENHVDGPAARLRPRPKAGGHLLTSITLSNFKGFAEKSRARLAPVTLIYGPNSSGKSSLLQTLLLMKQSVTSTTLETRASYPDLGSFLALLHGHDETCELKIGLTWHALSAWDDARGVSAPEQERGIQWTWRTAVDGGDELVDVELGVGDFNFKIRNTGEALTVDRQAFDRLLMALGDAAVFWVPPQTGEPPKSDDLVRRESDAANVRAGHAVDLLDRRSVDTLVFRRNGHLPGGLVPDPATLKVDGRRSSHAAARLAVGEAGRFVTSAAAEVPKLLEELSYLGPLRQAPQRFYRRLRTSVLGTEGEHLANFLFDHAGQVGAVNDWLDELGIGYHISVEPVQSTTIGDLVSIVLVDQESGVRLSPADVGYGISQLLPIVVQLVVSHETVVCIEQPEIHIHPRLQADLADLVIEAAHREGRANQVIIETHSEHLMLRLQKRIRRGELSAQDVSVLYVDRAPEGAARIRELRLDDDGFFADEWPHGFFDERLQELFDDDDEDDE